MPGGNRTGPLGQGPKTGRGLGFCSGNDQPGFENSNDNFAFGYGTGWRNRWGGGNQHRSRHAFRRFSENVSDVTLLENEARILKKQLLSIEKQLSELKKKTD